MIYSIGQTVPSVFADDAKLEGVDDRVMLTSRTSTT